MHNIRFIELDKLEKVEQDMVKTLAQEYYGKIQRLLNNETTLVVHIKLSTKGGNRQRYEITVRAEAPTRMFESHTDEWDLSVGLHKTFKAIEHEISHAFKT